MSANERDGEPQLRPLGARRLLAANLKIWKGTSP